MQITWWIKDKDGRYGDTIFVTRLARRKGYRFNLAVLPMWPFFASEEGAIRILSWNWRRDAFHRLHPGRPALANRDLESSRRRGTPLHCRRGKRRAM